MKKFAGIMVATVLAFSLVACGPVDSAVQNLAGAASNKGSDVVTADDDGYAEGRIGDVMRTYFFDYTVNSAYTCKEFEGYTPAEGNKLLVAELTVKNTDRSTVTMYEPNPGDVRCCPLSVQGDKRNAERCHGPLKGTGRKGRL